MNQRPSFRVASAPGGRSPSVRATAAGTFLLFALVVLLATVPPAWSASVDPAGRATVVLGIVEAVAADGTVRRLQRQAPVYEGDTIRSGPRGRAQIRFTDRGLLSIRPATEIAIEEHAFEPTAPARSRQTLNLRSGGFRALTGRIADSNRSAYRVRTPLAVIGVRGTIWDAFQQAGGPLLLGVSDGAIFAEVGSNIAELGEGASFNYARINPDGSIDYLIEPPPELQSSPEVDEGAAEEEAGDAPAAGPVADGTDAGNEGIAGPVGPGGTEQAGDERTADAVDAGGTEQAGIQRTASSFDAGGVENASIASGGGEAESSAGLLLPTGTQPVEIATNPEQTGAISRAESGSGSLPTEQPIPTVDFDAPLSPVDEAALVDGTAVALLAAPEPDGVAGGLGARTSSGGPLAAFDGETSGLDGLVGSARSAALDAADLFLTPASGTVAVRDDDFGGVPGLTWGRFASPVTVFTDRADASQSITRETDLLFAIGTPTDIAEFTGLAVYRAIEFRALSTGLSVDQVVGEVVLDFASGGVEGFLNVLLQDLADPESFGFSYLVDFTGQVNDGLLTATEIVAAQLRDENTEQSAPATASITGFVTGPDANSLQLAFQYATDTRDDADVGGLALLRSPRLTAAEATALGNGFGFVGVDCCFFDPGLASGRAVDARSADPLIGFNTDGGTENLGPEQPGFFDLPVDAIVRNFGGETTVASGFTAPGTDTLASVRWEAPLGTTGSFVGPNAGIQLLDAASGARLDAIDDRVLFVTGLPTDFADLTGQFTYGASVLLDGFRYQTFPLSDPTALGSVDVSFEVDFASASIANGSIVVLDPTEQVLFDALFGGAVVGGTGYNGTNLLFSGGTFLGQTPIDVESSEIGGFFAGATGEAFAGAFALVAANSAGDRAVGTFYALGEEGIVGTPPPPPPPTGTPLNALTAEETTALGQGFGFVGVECCFVNDGSGLSGASAIAQGPAVDLSQPVNAATPFLFGQNLDSDGLRAGAISTGFGDFPPDLVFRVDDATLSVVPTNQGGIVTAITSVAPVGIYDATTGELVDQVNDFLLAQAGPLANIADLTGSTRYDLVGISADFTATADGGPGALQVQGSTVSFNVDFATGAIFEGLARFAYDPDDFGQPIENRDGLSAFFTGQAGTSSGNAYMALDVLGGFYIDVDGDAGGNGIVDVSRSEMTGAFFEGGDFASLAYSFVTVPDVEIDPAHVPVNAAGIAVLERLDLALSAAEAADLGNGTVFVGAACCTDGGAGAGLATADLGDGRVLAINRDALDVDLSPLDPGFLDVTPEVLLRRAGAEQDPVFITTFLRPAPLVIPSLEQSAWVSTLGSALEVDAATGDIRGPVDDLVLFQTVDPVDASVQGVTGFRTFWGAISTGDIGGGAFTDGFQAIPSYGFTFNIDFATGELFNGHLFAEPAPGSDDFYQAFFEGQVAFGATGGGNSFVDFQVLGGNFGAQPLDLAESEIEGLFALDGTNLPLLVGSFSLTTGPDPADDSVAGIFSVGENPESRIDAADAVALDRLGITAFPQRDSDGLPFTADPDPNNPGQVAGLGGLLLGRATAVDPQAGAPFQLIANRLRNLPDTPAEIGPVRADLFGQPVEFVQRQGLNAIQLVGDADVVPSGAGSISGFEVGWGQWSGGSTVQSDAVNPANSEQILQSVFFASVNPTPTAGMPIVGTVSYLGSTFTGEPVAVLGQGFGDLSLSGPVSIGDFAFGFSIDFSTGQIFNGAVTVGVPSSLPLEWFGTFDGVARGAVAELNLASLEVQDALQGGTVGNGLLERSSLTGVFTGPAAERFVGGFSFDAAGISDPANVREAVQGVFVVDQLP